MSFLRLDGLTKRYGSLLAVDQLTLEVRQGEFISLLGPSGCGKTTTLHMIAGFAAVSSGRIKLDGQDITTLSPQGRNIGIVFQSYALFPHMTVYENVSFGLEMRKVRGPERKQRAMRALELVRLGYLSERYPRELSGGQQQRVALARALVIEPPLLLLDEPLSNLDAKLREDMQIELRTIQQKVGTTTLMVTHDQSEALSMSERIVIMNDGRMSQIAKPFEAYESPANVFVSTFVGKSNLFSIQESTVNNGQAELYVGGCCIGEVPSKYIAASRSDCVVSVRPERVEFVAAGAGLFDGTISMCQFIGDHWLFQVDSNAGKLVVTRPNQGRLGINVGDQVGISWPAEAIRVLRNDSKPSAN